MHSISNTAESDLIHFQRWTQWQEKSNERHDHCIGLDFVHSWLTRPGTLHRKNRDFKIWLIKSLSILILSSQEESFMNHLIIIYKSSVKINTVVMLFHRAVINLSGYYASACSSYTSRARTSISRCGHEPGATLPETRKYMFLNMCVSHWAYCCTTWTI